MSNKGFVRAAALDEVPPGRVKAVRIENEDVALCNVDGRLFAIVDRCPHQTFPLSKGELRGKVLKCDLHQWCFNVDSGENVANPNSRLTRFQVMVEAGQIWVRLVPLDTPEPPPERFISRDEA